MAVGELKADGVPRVVRALAEGLQAVLRDGLVGVYLGGSFVSGDFVAASRQHSLKHSAVEQLEQVSVEKKQAAVR